MWTSCPTRHTPSRTSRWRPGSSPSRGSSSAQPTGTGKTLIAEAALFEALHTGKSAYYTTPLIALTEQKFQEMQDRAVEWGFRREDVGLVTGSRKVNPEAPVLVVVAEILLNRLLNRLDFSGVTACVMDEFHNFAEMERGIVWELSLGMLPKHVRLLLLSATVGNSAEFVGWLARQHDRKIALVEGKERRVPLTYEWVPDQFLNEQLVAMAAGDEEGRRTPALVFCFDREECWSVAENVMGKDLNLSDEKKKDLHDRVNALDLSRGAGPKLKRLLHRGVGVHHAGLLPKYRLAVEELFQRKLLPVVVCTETLAAGINLPARSVVLSSLVKGPFGAKKLIDSSIAHQIFGRAGRPQFDDRGFVYALAHPDDVDILRWKAKYDAIPEDTRDPGLLKAKKALKKKKPKRRETEQYWVEGHFNQLQTSPPRKLYSKGPLPWRLLAYLLEVSPEVEGIRAAVRKRLMDDPRIAAGEKALDRMLMALHTGGFVTLSPEPPGAAAGGRPAPGALYADPGPADARAGETAGVPEHPSPLRRLPDRNPGRGRCRRARASDGERPRCARPGPEASPGPAQAAGIGRTRRLEARRRVDPERAHGRDVRGRRRGGGRRRRVGEEAAAPGGEAPVILRPLLPRSHRRPLAPALVRRRADRVRRQLQQLRDEPRPDQAGGDHLPPRPADDHALRANSNGPAPSMSTPPLPPSPGGPSCTNWPRS